MSTVLLNLIGGANVLNDILVAGGFILSVAVALYSLSILRSIFMKDNYKNIDSNSFELESYDDDEYETTFFQHVQDIRSEVHYSDHSSNY